MFFIVLGVLVLVHEFGHFTVAKLTRMKVHEFAFGFGPILLRLFKRGGTEYTIHAIPAGGFVRIAGMDPGEDVDVEGGFNTKPIWQRALVIFAGPFMSLVLGYLVLLMMGFVWGIDITGTTVDKLPETSPAAAAGMQKGDVVVSVDGKRVYDGYELRKTINGGTGKITTVVAERKGEQKTFRIKPIIVSIRKIGVMLDDPKLVIKQIADGSVAARAGLQKGDVISSIKSAKNGGTNVIVKRNGKSETLLVKSEITDLDSYKKVGVVLYDLKTTVTRVQTGSPAAKAGLHKGDVLVSVDGEKTPTSGDFEQILSTSEKPVSTVVVERGGKQITFEVSPKLFQQSIARQIGIILNQKTVYTRLFKQKAKETGNTVYTNLFGGIKIGTVETYRFTADTIQGLFSKQIKNAGGIVAIGVVTGQAVKSGIESIFFLLAMLSISLAVINLVPWPVLDGGHLIYLLIEKIRGKPLDPKKWYAIQSIGLFIIIGLAIFMVGYDLSRLDMWSNLK